MSEDKESTIVSQIVRRDELADFCLVFLIMYSKNSEEGVGEVMGI